MSMSRTPEGDPPRPKQESVDRSKIPLREFIDKRRAVSILHNMALDFRDIFEKAGYPIEKTDELLAQSYGKNAQEFDKDLYSEINEVLDAMEVPVFQYKPAKTEIDPHK